MTAVGEALDTLWRAARTQLSRGEADAARKVVEDEIVSLRAQAEAADTHSANVVREYEEHRARDLKRMRQEALSKLTPRERKILGLGTL